MPFLPIPFADSAASDFADSSLRWHDGRPLTGRITVRDDQGRPVLRETYLDGLRHGAVLQWDGQGQLRHLACYRYGVRL